MEEDTEHSLNNDFNYNLVIGKSLMSNLSLPQEQQLATDWLQKLSNSGTSLDELRLRNMFAYLLILSMQDGQLRPPFDAEPPVAPLTDLHHLLPGDVYGPDQDGDQEADRQDGARPPVFDLSPDGGAFLAAQPVPRCGAFCYLAVVARQDQ